MYFVQILLSCNIIIPIFSGSKTFEKNLLSISVELLFNFCLDSVIGSSQPGNLSVRCHSLIVGCPVNVTLTSRDDDVGAL